MPTMATRFLEIHFQGACEEAVAFGKRWKIMFSWCGFNVCHGPWHIRQNCVWVMVSDGEIDSTQIPPTEVYKIVLYWLPGEANTNNYEWPDWENHPHLKSDTLFERNYT